MEGILDGLIEDMVAIGTPEAVVSFSFQHFLCPNFFEPVEPMSGIYSQTPLLLVISLFLFVVLLYHVLNR